MATRRKKSDVKKPIAAAQRRVQIGIEDMVLLKNTKDIDIVENLKTRLQEEQIYSYIGHVLVVCNPYKWLKIYEDSDIKSYVNVSRIDMPPHIFAVGEAAYRNMVNEEDNQCIIISGESGAGKTEASKHIQNYIAAVSGGGEDVDKLKQIFLESNPVLEAFGNAKTLRNNNSSRFGKYFELKFNRYGLPQGGLITNYLLEKSRIVKPKSGERNFHIFYQLIASKNYSKMFNLKGGVESFNLLSCSKCYNVEGMNDVTDGNETFEAMGKVGLKQIQIESILNIVAAVLHLGNVSFSAKQVKNAEGSIVSNNTVSSLQQFCSMVQIDEAALTKVLTYRALETMAPGGKIEYYEVPQNTSQALQRKNAIAKSLYERLFDLIVKRINAALEKCEKQQSNYEQLLTIGVLDIYGFEVFEKNGFEQLCINYVNEKLQQIFIELTLRAEQDEYASEGIQWKSIPFFNNKIVCDLLDGAKPVSGVFRILDDTCKTMHGTAEEKSVDAKFVETSQQIHGSHKHFAKSGGICFIIKHYAGDVIYDADGNFSDSNRDSLNKDLLQVIRSSQDKLLLALFPDEEETPKANGKSTAQSTAGSKIRTQTASLVTALMDCSPHYIRCIKSNDLKKALTMDNKRVQHQVQYLGLVQNIQVRRAGFAYRIEFHRFLQRFAILSKLTYPEYKGSDKAGCKEIIKALSLKPSLCDVLTKEEVQLGKTKIFIKKPEAFFDIEYQRDYALGEFVAKIQMQWRKYKSERELFSIRDATAAEFKKEKKIRRRDSIYRPYLGDYLDSLGSDFADIIREDIFRVIDYYNKEENIIFADCSGYQLLASPSRSGDGFVLEPKLVVVTDGAIYLLDIIRDEKTWQTSLKFMNIPPRKLITHVVLRRRISLSRSDQVSLESLWLSQLADGFIGLMTKFPSSKIDKPDKSNWIPDREVSKCPITQASFGFFLRRHHCRASGGIFSYSCLELKQALPDRGWYQPERICDASFGLESDSVAEDVILLLSRKSELVALLRDNFAKVNNSAKINITYSNSCRLRKSPVTELSQVVASSITLQEGSPTAKSSKSKNNANHRVEDEYLLGLSLNKDSLQIQVAPGLSVDIVEERRKRQLERRKIADAKRKALDEERRKRAAKKERQREKEHQARLAEKKAKKKQMREEQKQKQVEEEEIQEKKVASKTKALSEKVSKPPSAAQSELAAAMARRRVE